MTAPRFIPGRVTDRAQQSTNDRLANTVDALQPAKQFPLRTDARINVEAGAFVRSGPRAAGQEIVVPRATAANFGQTITILKEGTLGPLRVRASEGTINAATSFTIPAANTTLFQLVSNGDGKWLSIRASAFPTAGNSLSYDGDELNYVGSGSLLRLSGVSGNLGTIDISTLECGGALCIVAAAGDYTIEGFTSTPAKPEGFWFVFAASNTAVLGTISNEDATAASADRIRLTNNETLVSTNIQGTVHAVPSDGLPGGTNRWRFVVGAGAGNVQTITTAGLNSNVALDPNTRVLRVDTGNSAWSIDGIAGGYAGRKLTIMNASNLASTGTLVTSGSSVSAVGNQIITPDNVDRGGYNRASFELDYDATDGFWRIAADTVGNPGKLLRRTVLTTGTGLTFNHILGAKTCKIIGCGGGGAGGGRAAGAGSGGSCGGSGTWGERYFTIAAATSTYTVGAAGVGVSGATGGAGTSSTWTHNAVTTTLPGGSGGIFRAAAVGPATQLGGAGGGAATNADDSCPGQQGGALFLPAAAVQPLVHLGPAGSTPIGNGGAGTACLAIANITGIPGTGYGAGSSGNLQGAAGAAAAAPNGQPGVWIVEEYG